MEKRSCSEIQICEVQQCTGCFACKAICPKQAIIEVEDEYGKTIPQIDEEKCVGCGLCSKVCPVCKPREVRHPKKCYAAWTKWDQDRVNCASGGIATGIGRYFIEQGGVVFGSKFTGVDELKCEISMAATMEELEDFKSSKYVQVSTGNSYQKAKEQLELGIQVLYVGTPCQIAGLLNFLRKDYENLTTMDLICHGVPPMKYLQEYAKAVADCKVTRATFRGRNDFMICLYQDGETQKNDVSCYRQYCYKDYYYEAFLRGLIYRDNCYQCQYAKTQRVADITIGDFWGLDKDTLKHSYDGRISEVLIHTPQGEKIFSQCEKYFVYEERKLEEAVAGNEQLRSPSPIHPDCGIFKEKVREHGFVKAVKATRVGATVQKNVLADRKWIKAMRKIKRIVKRIYTLGRKEVK